MKKTQAEMSREAGEVGALPSYNLKFSWAEFFKEERLKAEAKESDKPKLDVAAWLRDHPVLTQMHH